MRPDSIGMFWEDLDHKNLKKFQVLKRNGWIEIIPNYWIDEKIYNKKPEDYFDHIYPLHRAYEMVRGVKEKRVPPHPVWLEESYLPNLYEAQNFKFDIFTDEELINASMSYMLTGEAYELEYDIECYSNYVLIAFYCTKTKKVIYFEKHGNEKSQDCGKLRWVFEKFKIVGFNSNGYDIFIASMFAADCSTYEMKSATTAIIERQERGYNVLKQFKVKQIKANHVDLIEVAPLFASLKIYGGRMHCHRMQDLPFEPGRSLNNNQKLITRWYCINDLATTSELKIKLKEELQLREQMSAEYGVDLRSKSDAQIAEAVIAHELEEMTGQRYHPPTILPGTSYKYKKPHFINFQTPLMKSVLALIENADFVVSETGNIGLPNELKELKINIGKSTYTMGIGGLHSNEKSAAHYSSNDYMLVDRDVVSYYPFIILILGLFPSHIGRIFLNIYKSIVDRRLEAKRKKNKKVANSLKIVINGSFGKFGSMFSKLYAPDLLIQTTITGQLALLMQIEALELCGIEVVSANTDGVVMKCNKAKEPLMEQVIKWWEGVTGFETEATKYKMLLSQNVNNYIGVKFPEDVQEGDERIKVKGCFARAGLSKNPTNEICIQAIEALLCDGVPLERTIKECRDIRQFLNVRTVKGGAVKVWDRYVEPHNSKLEYVRKCGWHEYYGENNWRHKDAQGELAVVNCTLDELYERCLSQAPVNHAEYLGKAIRWYYAKGVDNDIVYALSGNRVPKSEGAKPLMVLPDEFPNDVDYDWYIAEAEKMLALAGHG